MTENHPAPALRSLVASVIGLVIAGCASVSPDVEAKSSTDLYHKSVAMIPMRDGVKLYTEIYRPKKQTKDLPIVFLRMQSSWFPLIDRNPQTFVDIPNAEAKDYRPAEQRVYFTGESASYILMTVAAPKN